MDAENSSVRCRVGEDARVDVIGLRLPRRDHVVTGAWHYHRESEKEPAKVSPERGQHPGRRSVTSAGALLQPGLNAIGAKRHVWS